MATRRKKTAPLEPESLPSETAAAGLSVSGLTPVEAPKKKRAPRKKKVAGERPAAVEIPLKPHHPDALLVPKSPLSSAALHKPIPVLEDKAIADVWRPSKKILRRPGEVEDIYDDLKDTDSDEAVDAMRPAFVRPPVRAGMFRKIAVAFALVALAVLVFVGYVLSARATVIVYPKMAVVKTERIVTVAADPQAGEVGGEVLEVTVSDEKSAAPGGFAPQAATSTALTPTLAQDANVTYVGIVTIFNETTTAQTLVPTTRLLLQDGTLFRLKDRVSVPAKGSVKAAIYADKAGHTGSIGPSSFTIPGLPVEKQKVVYAQSDTATVPGDRNIPTPAAPVSLTSGASAPIVQADDITGIETALRGTLISQAQDQLKTMEKGSWSGQALLVETMSRSVSASPGEHASVVTVHLTLRVREVRFDREKALGEAQADLQRALTSDRQLTDVQNDTAGIIVEQADPKGGMASIRLTLAGTSAMSMQSPLFDADKLRGLGLNSVQTYFANIEGIERVDVVFFPPWPRRMPDLKDHIKFQVQSQP